MGNGGADGEQHALQIDVDHQVDVVAGHGGQRARAVDAGAVDQNVEPAELASGLVHHRPRAVRTGDVSGDGQRREPVFP